MMKGSALGFLLSFWLFVCPDPVFSGGGISSQELQSTQSNALALSCPHTMSVTQYSYTEVPIPTISSRTSLVFAVKACKDAHIALSTSLDLGSNMVEIVIGANSNRYQSIRNCKLNCLLESRYDSLLSCESFTTFWVSWESSAVTTIRLGLGSQVGSDTYLTHDLSNVLIVNHASVASYGDNLVVWLFDFPEQTNPERCPTTVSPTTEMTSQATTTSAAAPTTEVTTGTMAETTTILADLEITMASTTEVTTAEPVSLERMTTSKDGVTTQTSITAEAGSLNLTTASTVEVTPETPTTTKPANLETTTASTIVETSESPTTTKPANLETTTASTIVETSENPTTTKPANLETMTRSTSVETSESPTTTEPVNLETTTVSSEETPESPTTTEPVNLETTTASSTKVTTETAETIPLKTTTETKPTVLTAQPPKCRCMAVTPSTEQDMNDAEEAAAKLKDHLMIKNETSSQKRQRTSAEDPRPSAQTVGSMGIAMLVLVFLLITIPDFLSCAVWFVKRLKTSWKPSNASRHIDKEGNTVSDIHKNGKSLNAENGISETKMEQRGQMNIAAKNPKNFQPSQRTAAKIKLESLPKKRPEPAKAVLQNSENTVSTDSESESTRLIDIEMCTKSQYKPQDQATISHQFSVQKRSLIFSQFVRENVASNTSSKSQGQGQGHITGNDLDLAIMSVSADGVASKAK